MSKRTGGLASIASFRWRAILLLTLVVGGPQMLFTVSIIKTQNKGMEQAETVKGDLLAEIAARSLIESLRTQNRMQTIRNLAVLRTDPDFAGARVISGSGQVIAQIGSPRNAPDAELQQHVAHIRMEKNEGETVQVVVYRSLASLREMQQLLGGARFINLAFFLCTFAAALMLINAAILRPLSQIGVAIGRIRDGKLSHPIPYLTRKDEVGEVARALDTFRVNALEMQVLRKGRELRARQHRHRILRALEATQDAVLILSADGSIEFANPRARRYFDHAVTGDTPLFANVANAEHRERIEAAINGVQPLDLTTELHIDPAGADVSDFPEDTLPVAIRIAPITEDEERGIGTVILVSDNSFQDRISSRIRRLADFDSLTGLHNRRVLEERLEEQLAADPAETALVLLDLDRFKTINDTLGHPVGDELLIHVAGLLRRTAGAKDLAARMGGDEFAMLITRPDAAERAVAISEAIVSILERPVRLANRALQTGASVGIALDPSPEATAQDIIREADLALYAAKNQGRGRATRFQPHMEQDVQRKSQIEGALRSALAQRRITAHFQRQHALDDGALVGFEALARWEDDTLGTVSPAEFVPVAEETGQIRELTIQMLDIACRFAAEARKLGFGGHVSVNISPNLFADDMTELIRDSLLVHNCPADALVVEITEAVFLAKGLDARGQMRTLQDMGVTIALDDFGMGYSSLSYLQRFPVNHIKIDRAFVSRMLSSGEARAIVCAIVELGHALGMTVTGEGAETEGERDALRAAKADFVQGYVDGTPVPREQAMALVRESIHSPSDPPIVMQRRN
ncbi:EAL domain-containing protein [Oceanibium sediminis]|uniref:EAL domain-containing protein n=1 Tax=Oceanibium sediminis TaxID=2026339 RepID=UPI000DD3AD09|nr:EAL domain-containing protein [Oceanibium sediminis]